MTRHPALDGLHVHRAKRGGCDRGITLIELMVVVALFAIVVALAGPSMRELILTQRLKSLHAALVTDLRQVRSESISGNQKLILEYRSDGSMACYMVIPDTGEAFGAGGCDCLRPEGQTCQGLNRRVLKVVQIPRTTGVELAASSSAAHRAIFDPSPGPGRGHVTPADFQFELKSDARGRLRVSIGPSGTVSSCSPDGSVRQVDPCP